MEVIEILGEKGNAVETATADMKVRDIVGKLAARKIGAIVVAGPNGEPAGIISERDIVRGLATEGPEILDRPASEIMTANVETCGPSDDITELMMKMVFGRFRHLPVLEGARMVGIVSVGDIVKGALRDLKIKTDIIQGYIIQPYADQSPD